MAQFIYNHNNYELEIDYNPITKQYEGKCKELKIKKLSSSNKEWLESCFRERVDNSK